MSIKEQIIIDMDLFDCLIEDDISPVPESFAGDYSIPCFKLSKLYKKSPAIIAEEICTNRTPKGIISKFYAAGPYINVTLDCNKIAQFVFQNIQSNNNYGNSDIGIGKSVCIDYSSITLSKQIHIGHLCTTVIGECLAKLYENAGYKVIRINYLGDMGTPFGKIITMYKHHNNLFNLSEMSVSDVQHLYSLFASEEEANPNLIEEARMWSLKIEKNDQEAVFLCDKFKSIALKEAKDIYSLLNIDFDDWRGENYYNTKTDSVLELLSEKGLLFVSEGAKCVDLNSYGLGICLIQRSDGGSLYTTRDLAAAIDRYEKYKFDECVYVTGIEQEHHFLSFFKVLELAGFDWAKKLKYIGYGRMSTELGKISGREGNTPIIKDIFKASIEKANEILDNRGVDENTAINIGVSAVVFSVLKSERIKNAVFSLEQAISFEGGTSTYIQYSNVRLKTIVLKNRDLLNTYDSSFTKYLTKQEEMDLLLKIDELPHTLSLALKECEPSYVSRYALELSALINKFYTNVRITNDEHNKVVARIKLCSIISSVLEKVMKILGIKVIEKM